MKDDIGSRYLVPYLPRQIPRASRNMRIGKKQQSHPVILQHSWPLAPLTARLGSGLARVEGVFGIRRTDVATVVAVFAGTRARLVVLGLSV
jgi:hypothetical protein